MSAAPAIGARAPAFELPDQHGQAVTLSAFHGSGVVVLMFFPFAFTGVCTDELRALKAAGPRLRPADGRGTSDGGGAPASVAAGHTHVLAVSCDTMFSLRTVADQEGLDFPVLSDFWPHGDVARRYGVFDEERGCARRGTFIIDRAGAVRWSVITPIRQARDVEEYVQVVRQLR